MNKAFENYTDNVLARIGVRGKKAVLIREDIYASLIEKQQNTGEIDPYILIGDPEEVAQEFRENLEIKNENNRRYGYGYSYRLEYEYISKTKLFGIPLIHVSTRSFGVAKGIIAIGTISVGVVSIGAISIGLLSAGAFAVGLISAVG